MREVERVSTYRRAGRFFATAILVIGLLGLTPAQATIFDDGNDRQILFDLRRKPDDTLTDKEKMTLRAADKYGNVGFCSASGGNASLIDYFGRPAMITSAHMVFDRITGRKLCSDAQLRNASFLPNVSYLDERSKYPRSFTHRKVKIVVPAINEYLGFDKPSQEPKGLNVDKDYLLYYLQEDITRDEMPGGHLRGAMKLASLGQGISAYPTNIIGEAVQIGIAPDIRSGLSTLYQFCNFNIFMGFGVRHNCDTVSGSSGSMIATPVGNELHFLGVHSGGTEFHMPPTDNMADWNIATPMPDPKTFEAGAKPLFARLTNRYLEPFRNPSLIAYQIQFLLGRTGCYTGKLDNQWGPASRKALAQFVSRSGASLPGQEPTQELWNALEEAVKAREAVCE